MISYEHNPVKEKLQAGKPVIGTWISLASAISAEAMAQVGWDWIVVDAQHSAIGYENLVRCFQAITGRGPVPMARVSWNRGPAVLLIIRVASTRCSHHMSGFCSAHPGRGADIGISASGEAAAAAVFPVSISRREAFTAELPTSYPIRYIPFLSRPPDAACTDRRVRPTHLILRSKRTGVKNPNAGIRTRVDIMRKIP